MSTRRARIKAVTSLPPRRKNVDIKNKQTQVKEEAEKDLKSPRTPRLLTEKKHEIKGNVSPPGIELDLPTQNKELSDSLIKIPNINDNTKSSPKVDSLINATEKIKVTPKHLDKVTVNTSIVKTNMTIFAPPQLHRDSSIRKAYASLLAPSPKQTTKSVDINQAKFISPQRNKSKPNAQIINENNELQITDKNVNKIIHNTVSPLAKIVTEDYNEPHVLESIISETVMDGIVPLQHAGSAPKPIDLLKNEIISETVEVLFDPIVPLPSPSKVRPKLRPAPRLGPHRRNSIQGSASESEDETRRAQISSGASTSIGRQRRDSHTSLSTLPSLPNREVSRIRNDSVCSGVSQVTAQPAVTASPLKEKHNNKSRRQEAATRRMSAMRRKRENVKRDTMTMYDLIFYNPSSNPIIPDQDEMRAKQENALEEAKRANKTSNDHEKKEDADDPSEVDDALKTDATPVPQIKLGPNGEIILDEKSLVIKQTGDGRKVSSVVREGSWGGGGGKYKRGPRTAEWSAAETVRFYRALAAIGTDFTLMAQLFPDRNRRDLKIKFKKEEKQNGAQVDKALRSATTWDALQLQSEFDAERAEAKRQARTENEQLESRKLAERARLLACRELRVRNSRGSKAMESTMIPGITQIRENEVTTADEFLERSLESKQTKKRKIKNSEQGAHGVLSSPPIATLTLINQNKKTPRTSIPQSDNTLSTPIPNQPTNEVPNNGNSTPVVPPNIENGSLVVLTVNDPSSPTKKMLQTYIAHGGGRLTPVALPTTLLNSVVGYMKKGTPKSTVSNASSPHFTSPNSVTSQDSRSCGTPSAVPVNPSPVKRQRHSSFTITQI